MLLTPELTITSPCVHSIVESQHIYHGQPYARVDNPIPELTLSPSQGLWIWPRSSVCGKNGVWIYRVTSTFLWFNHGNPTFICRGINRSQVNDFMHIIQV
jgi:hypothetical protein